MLSMVTKVVIRGTGDFLDKATVFSGDLRNNVWEQGRAFEQVIFVNHNYMFWRKQLGEPEEPTGCIVKVCFRGIAMKIAKIYLQFYFKIITYYLR